eukprot:514961-Rhodomonas_salina.1
MDSQFQPKKGKVIDWEELKAAMIMIERWLVPDPDVRLELRFNRTVQRASLLEYVALFQVVDSAPSLAFSNLEITDWSKVIQVTKGLKEREARYELVFRSKREGSGAQGALRVTRFKLTQCLQTYTDSAINAVAVDCEIKEQGTAARAVAVGATGCLHLGRVAQLASACCLRGVPGGRTRTSSGSKCGNSDKFRVQVWKLGEVEGRSVETRRS